MKSKRIGRKPVLFMMIFSCLVGVGGVVLLANSHAAELAGIKIPIAIKKNPPAPLVKGGDLNKDGVVNIADVSKFLSLYKGKDKDDDLNKDHVVDAKDLDILLANYNNK